MRPGHPAGAAPARRRDRPRDRRGPRRSGTRRRCSALRYSQTLSGPGEIPPPPSDFPPIVPPRSSRPARPSPAAAHAHQTTTPPGQKRGMPPRTVRADICGRAAHPCSRFSQRVPEAAPLPRSLIPARTLEYLGNPIHGESVDALSVIVRRKEAERRLSRPVDRGGRSSAIRLPESGCILTMVGVRSVRRRVDSWPSLLAPSGAVVRSA